ncbi:MAG: EamA family transporter [Firmicutes bacterium]|nr:EamA family transporter [Bacillota bacterium]MBR3183087.1 EamA family transporter [Bacillota bacterium]
MKKDSNATTGYILVLCAGILWGSIGFFVRKLNGLGVDTELTAFMRIFCAWIILIPLLMGMSLKSGRNYFKISKKGLLQCFIMGLVTQAFFNLSYSGCINSVGVAMGSVLLYTAPIFVSILSRLLFKEEINARKGISLVINLLGCFIMVTGGDLSVLKVSGIGILLGIGAGFFYAMVTILGKFTSDEVDPFTMVFYNFLFGWISLALISNPIPKIAAVSDLHFWLLAFGYGLIPTVGSYLFYMNGISHDVELSRVPIIASVEPIIATIIGLLVFGENITLVNALGLVIVLFSIVLMNSGRKEKADG